MRVNAVPPVRSAPTAPNTLHQEFEATLNWINPKAAS